jgi:hypothetical protein
MCWTNFRTKYAQNRKIERKGKNETENQRKYKWKKKRKETKRIKNIKNITTKECKKWKEKETEHTWKWDIIRERTIRSKAVNEEIKVSDRNTHGPSPYSFSCGRNGGTGTLGRYRAIPVAAPGSVTAYTWRIMGSAHVIFFDLICVY